MYRIRDSTKSKRSKQAKAFSVVFDVIGSKRRDEEVRMIVTLVSLALLSRGIRYTR